MIKKKNDLEKQETSCYIATFISRSGHCSRRNAIELVKAGRVHINNIVVTNPATKVTADAIVTIDRKVLKEEGVVHILFNKPIGCITTTSDEKSRKTVFDYIKIAEKLFPVGRLDQDTTGLLLLTNDGMLAQQLMHPKFEIEKEYYIALEKPLEKTDFEKIRNGVWLPDGFLRPDRISYTEENNPHSIALVIHSGKKRIIRRLFAHFGYEVTALDRIGYAIFSKKGLDVGTYRQVTKDELKELHTYIKARSEVS